MILLRSRYYQRTLDLAFSLRNRDDVIFPNNHLGSNFDYESRVLLAPRKPPRAPYPKFGYIFEFLTPTLPIHYYTFIGLR